MRGWLTRLSELFGLSGPDEDYGETGILYRERRAIAHECGHAVIAWLSPAVLSVDCISFRQRGDRGATTTMTLIASHPDYLTENAVISLGGMAGELIVWDRVRSGGFADDIPRAIEVLETFLKTSSPSVLAKRWAGSLAESSLDVGAMLAKHPRADLCEVLNLCYRRGKRLLQDNRSGFDRLVALAGSKGDLTREDIASQFGPRIWARRP